MARHIDVFVFAALDELERFYYSTVVPRFFPPDPMEQYENTQASFDLLESGMCHCVLYVALSDQSRVLISRTQKQELDEVRDATKRALDRANSTIISFVERRLAQKLDTSVEHTAVIDPEQLYKHFWAQLNARFDRVSAICEGGETP